MLQGTDKTPALINDYKEYHTDSTVKFLVRMSEEKLIQAEAAGLHKVFKLQSSLTCNSMVRLHPPDLEELKGTPEIQKDADKINRLDGYILLSIGPLWAQQSCYLFIYATMRNIVIDTFDTL